MSEDEQQDSYLAAEQLARVEALENAVRIMPGLTSMLARSIANWILHGDSERECDDD